MSTSTLNFIFAVVYNVLAEKGCAFAKDGEGREGQIFLSQKRGRRMVADRENGKPFFLFPRRNRATGEVEYFSLPQIDDTVVIVEVEKDQRGRRSAESWALLTPDVVEGLRIYRAALVTILPGGKKVVSPKFGLEGRTLWEIRNSLRRDNNLFPRHAGLLGSKVVWELKIEEGRWVECEDPVAAYEAAVFTQKHRRRGGTEVGAPTTMIGA